MSTSSRSRSMTLSRASTPCSSSRIRPSRSRMSLRSSVEGVELARELGEVVVGRGQLPLADGLDGHGDVGVLAAPYQRAGRGRTSPTPPALETRRPPRRARRRGCRCRARRTGCSGGVLDHLAVAGRRRGRSRGSRPPAAARSTGVSVAKRARSASTCSSICSSVTSASATSIRGRCSRAARSWDVRRPRP